MQLLYEIIFLQAPDDRGGWIPGNAVVAVACVTNEQLGAEDGLSLSGISWRRQGGLLRDMGCRGPLNGICRRRKCRQSDQNAENRRKMIVGHILHTPPVRACGPV